MDGELAAALRGVEGALDLDEALLGYDDAVGQDGAAGEGALDLGQTVTVRRHHAAAGAVTLEVDAVQVEARLVVGDREQRLVDHLAQR